MKSLIVYYSSTSNTASAAIILSNILNKKGEVKIIALETLDEAKGFFAKCRRAIFKKKALIEDVEFDASGYDLVCIGSPVWAFAPAPAINTYLDKVKGLENKQALVFLTCGSGLGAGKALHCIKRSLIEKGASGVKELLINQHNSKNKEFIEEKIKELNL
jgi:flavodoxin